MFNFLRRLWVRIRGLLITTGDEMVSNSPEAIKSTYAAAIDDARKDYKEMQQGLAMIMQQEKRLENAVDSADATLKDLEQKLNGALEAAEADPSNTLHKDAGAKYISRIKEVKERREQNKTELDSIRAMLDKYKSQLTKMHSQVEDLQRERSQMLADYVTANNALKLEDKLSGMVTDDSTNEAVVAIREKVRNMQAQVQVAAEMRGATVQDDVYAEIGSERDSANRFDELLAARAKKPEAKTKSTVTTEPEVERELG